MSANIIFIVALGGEQYGVRVQCERCQVTDDEGISISFHFNSVYIIVPPRLPPCLIRAVIRIRHRQSVANARGRRVKVHGLFRKGELHMIVYNMKSGRADIGYEEWESII